MILTQLPPEIIHHILGYVDPSDLAWIPRICKNLYHAVTGNTTLFKQVYLRHLDTPREGHGVNWEQALKDVVRLQVILRSHNVDHKKSELQFVHDTTTALLSSSATQSDRAQVSSTYRLSRNADLLASFFSRPANQSAFLCRSFIYERARGEFRPEQLLQSPPRREHQMSAHLHCLYGAPVLSASPGAYRQTRRGDMRPFACSKVYDLRQYTEKTKWGPFMDDDTGRVDWEKAEAIMIVLGANLKLLGLGEYPLCKGFCQIPFAGTWPESYHPLPMERESVPKPLELQDPYGVTGTWLRVVCFLDYTDFYMYNFNSEDQPPPHVPRKALDVEEATRLILMQITVTKIEPPGPDDGQELPVVSFKGVSRSMDESYDENANSDLRGHVRLTREGEVRWTTFSVFGGMERWRSESVQIGGVKSAKGVIGHWFDKDYDPRGPAGPTAFWKVSDRTTSTNRSFLHEFMPPMMELSDDDDDDDIFHFGESDEDDGEEHASDPPDHVEPDVD
ncbi:hypothetical protein F5X99DRAFT_392444 [Biscogniauxia marginata]|nr:hypothetical protein F5X99DRAFT_392444 [Biscogniauxia marginata]